MTNNVDEGPERNEWVRDLLSVVIAFVVMVVSSRVGISIPAGTAVADISLQSLAVVLIASILSPPLGRMSILLYLIIGLLGLPVFSEGAGVDYFRGPTGGYLLGFLAAAILIEFFLKTRDINKPINIFLVNVIGTLTILVCGMLYLAYLTDIQDAFRSGFMPFLPGAAIKIALGSGLLWLWTRYLSRGAGQ